MTDLVIQENKENSSDSDNRSKQSSSYSDNRSKQSSSDSDNKSKQTKIINIVYDENIATVTPITTIPQEVSDTSENNSHLEVFSNDTENKNSLNNSSNTNDLTNKITSETINKSLTRLKLPELQDKAIELKIQLSSNGKKKTRTELINEIKTHS